MVARIAQVFSIPIVSISFHFRTGIISLDRVNPIYYLSRWTQNTLQFLSHKDRCCTCQLRCSSWLSQIRGSELLLTNSVRSPFGGTSTRSVSSVRSGKPTDKQAQIYTWPIASEESAVPLILFDTHSYFEGWIILH
jgi:hypothetical protein